MTYRRCRRAGTGEGVKSNEQQWRVNIPEELAEAFAGDLKDRGMPQREGTIRLMRFYLGLDPDLRALVLGTLTPHRTAALARLILKQLGRRK